MYTSEGLLDILTRTHRSFSMLMAHCQELSAEELNRELDGFGAASFHLQLHHAIAAQKYWIGVLEGRMDVDNNESDYPSVDTLEGYRREAFKLTESYASSASVEELNTPRTMTTWGDNERTLTPAHVVLRTLVHFYHHQGQIAAMCRLLGNPVPPGMDFPLDPPGDGQVTSK